MQSIRSTNPRTIWLVIGAILVVFAIISLGWLGFLAVAFSLLLAITVHECAHAWTADRLGDPTARLMGRVSLNPIAHLDPLGTLMMLFTAISGFGIGWGKPVPVSPHRLRFGSRLGNGLVALSGPASNLLTAVLLALVLRGAQGILALPWWFLLVLSMAVRINIGLAMFNLLPLPPLDGSSVLLGVLSLFRGRWAWDVSQFMMRLASYGPMVLIIVLLVGPYLGLDLIGWLVGRPAALIYRFLVGAMA